MKWTNRRQQPRARPEGGDLTARTDGHPERRTPFGQEATCGGKPYFESRQAIQSLTNPMS
jgi:hypothetical protein